MKDNDLVAVRMPAKQRELLAQAVEKSGMNRSEFIRQALITAAQRVLDSDADYGRNSPIAGAELVITEQGQSQLIRDVLAVKVMVSRLYGEMAVTKLGGREAAQNDVTKLHREVEEMITEHGLVFE